MPPALDATVVGLLERALDRRLPPAHEVVTRLATLPPELATVKLE